MAYAPEQVWNCIVDEFKKKTNEKEELIQAFWEQNFTDLGYSRRFGTLLHQPVIKIGSNTSVRADIVCKKDEESFVVELKRENHKKQGKDSTQQLFSYLKQAKLSLGLLICDRIYVYNYDVTSKDDDDHQEFIEIPFDKDNERGIRLMELLQIDALKKADIHAFVHKCRVYDANVEEIVKKVTSEYVLELLNQHLQNEYAPKEINEALKRIKVEVLAPDDRPEPPKEGRKQRPAGITPRRARQLLKWDWLYEQKIINEGDEIYVRNHPDAVAVVADATHVKYDGETMSFNEFAALIFRGSKTLAIRSYEYLFPRGCEKSFNELREERMRSLGLWEE